MANFSFKVCSHNRKSKKKFCVSVSTDEKIYIQLKHRSKADVDLKKDQSFTIKFCEENKDNAYMKWPNSKQDKYKLNDLPGDFNDKNKPFTLNQVQNDKLSWQVKCIENTTSKKSGVGDSNVTVTFGEDPPIELPRKD